MAKKEKPERKTYIHKNKYEVYICKLNDEVLYVGSGRTTRHKHCNSGTSHLYELNKLHFQGITFDMEVMEYDTKEEALMTEKFFIADLKPKLNTMFNPMNRMTGVITYITATKDYKDYFLRLRNKGLISVDQYRLYYSLVAHLFKFYTIDLMELGIKNKVLYVDNKPFIRNMITGASFSKQYYKNHKIFLDLFEITKDSRVILRKDIKTNKGVLND